MSPILNQPILYIISYTRWQLFPRSTALIAEVQIFTVYINFEKPSSIQLNLRSNSPHSKLRKQWKNDQMKFRPIRLNTTSTEGRSLLPKKWKSLTRWISSFLRALAISSTSERYAKLSDLMIAPSNSGHSRGTRWCFFFRKSDLTFHIPELLVSVDFEVAFWRELMLGSDAGWWILEVSTNGNDPEQLMLEIKLELKMGVSGMVLELSKWSGSPVILTRVTDLLLDWAVGWEYNEITVVDLALWIWYDTGFMLSLLLPLMDEVVDQLGVGPCEGEL